MRKRTISSLSMPFAGVAYDVNEATFAAPRTRR